MKVDAPLLLPGLVGSQPLGFLAALGVLRLLARERPSARLAWDNSTDEWRGVISFADDGPPASRETLLTALSAAAQARPTREELTFADDIKIAPSEFATAVREIVGNATATKREAADFLAAFGSELITAASTGDVKPTAFHMTSGQQQFLQMGRELVGAMSREAAGQFDHCAAAVEEALFGPWRYADKQHSFGWDPANEPLHALRARSPTKEGQSSVRAAVWLAFEALPFFPTAPGLGNRLVTAGFGRDPNGPFFTWPLWNAPLAMDGIRGVLHLEELQAEQPSSKILSAVGVAAAFRCARRDLGDKGYAILRPATAVT